MTPEEAESIYYAACKVEYHKHCDNYTPVNQRLVELAGFAAVIAAVKNEDTVEFVHKYFDANP